MKPMNPKPVPTPEFAALLLAGGQSRRMGRNKADLPWQGQSLLQHLSDLLKQAGARRIWHSGPFQGEHALPDSEPGLGPMGGVLSLARVADNGLYLVVPVDMPRLEAGLLQHLLRALDQVEPTVRAACFVDFPLPLALRLDEASRDLIEQHAQRERSARSLRALHQGLAGIHCPVPNGCRDLLDNCNTPEQWQALSRVQLTSA